MKYFFTTAMFFVTSVALADSIICDVKSGSEQTLIIELDQNKKGVQSIDLQTVDSVMTRIYSRWPAIRGEFSVGYCNPNENSYREYSGQYNLFSQCISDSKEHISLSSQFSAKLGGIISYQKRDLSFVDLEFSNCK